MLLGPKVFGVHSGFFQRSECKLKKNEFGIRKIFASWRAKHEAWYMVNMKKNKIKTCTPQFFINQFLVWGTISTVLLTAHIFGVPKQMPRWTFGVRLTYNASLID